MKSPLLNKLAQAALDHQTAYVDGNELEAFRGLSADLHRLRSMTNAKISAWSEGLDTDAADQFAISVYVFHGGQTVREDHFGYSAQGLHRAAVTAKWYVEMNKYDDVAIHFTEDGFAEFLGDKDTARVIDMAMGSDDMDPLRELRDWCVSHMNDRAEALWG